MSWKKPNVLWQPNSDPQKAFLRSTARHCLIGGGNASGKTSALAAAAAMQTANPKHRAIIFRKDYPSLKHIISASYALFLPLRATYNRSDHVWSWPSGSTLEYSHLEDEAAVFQHAGKQYSFLGFDEVTQLGADATDSRGNPICAAFAFMQTRLRADADSGLRLECRATATPSGPGMGWVKNFYQIPDSGESSEFVHPVTGYRHQYIRALASDNPAIDAAEYERQMADLPEAQRKSLVNGDWTAHVGQVFTEWRYDRHTCEPFPIPESFELFRGADDGFASPAAVVWCARDPILDRIYIVAELIRRGMTAEVMANAVLEIDKSIPRRCGQRVCENGSALRGVIDSASFADIGSGSRGQEMNKLGCGWTPCEKTVGSRVAGVNRLHAVLAPKEDGPPGLIAFRSCRIFISQIPQLCYSKTNPEDVSTEGEDHMYDATRYALGHRKLASSRVRVI